MSNILDLARPDLLELKPYSHATWAPELERLHANELPWRPAGDDSVAGLNRYPEPHPHTLIAKLAELYGVEPQCVLAGRGSDEAIDLLARGFCRAGRDAVLTCPPTFGMYAVAAKVQGAKVVEVPLLREQGFALDEEAILARVRENERSSDARIKIVFVCSPGNPTANLVDPAVVERLCLALEGRALVALDEAYIEFAGAASFVGRLSEFRNLVILRTMSKAFALAGARCGALIADPAIIEFLGRLIPPYAVPSPTIEAVLRALASEERAKSSALIQTIKDERARLLAGLARLPQIRKVWPSDTNFILVDCEDAERCFRAGIGAGLLVRDVRKQPALGDSLRITVGSPEQNRRLLLALEAA
jgi:histidinol-phosphate aminotransferase